MQKLISNRINTSRWEFIIPAAGCLFGIVMIVVLPLGPRLSLLPGDFGDARLNNYLLEHFYRWISGVDHSFWSANFYYPFPYTTAFSENFSGSGIFYALCRWIGFDPETAFQGWYVWGYLMNYAAAAFVLSRLKFNPLGIAAGAFFFTFGLPVLAKENHVQLLYRFGVPLACLSFWRMLETQKIRSLVLLLFWTAWQCYLSIYSGVFLLFLLFSLAVICPFFKQNQSFIGLIRFWPGLFKLMWARSSHQERWLGFVCISVLLFTLGVLFRPYYQVERLYGFARPWKEVSTMLLNWKSFFTADRSLIWRPVSKLIADYPMRHEHNMFIGIPAALCILISFVWHRRLQNKRLVFLHVFAAILLVILTFRVRGFSLYSLIWPLPGIGSIRAVSRIFLILMWPLSLCIAYAIDQLSDRTHTKHNLLSIVAIILVAGLMIDPVFFNHGTFSKLDAQNRISKYFDQIPSLLPERPILILAHNRNEVPLITDLDSMLLAQRLGWPTMNGYSGNNPPGYGQINSCRSITQRILAYMAFAGISSESYYDNIAKRVVPLGFQDCNPLWKVRKPDIYAGPLPQEVFEGITIRIVSIVKEGAGIKAEVLLTNHSSRNLPAFSSTQNPVRLSWRLVNMETGQGLSGFDARKDLDNDLYPGEEAVIMIDIVPPEMPGEYQLEVTAVQEQVDWFYDRGLPVEISKQTILVDGQDNLTIRTPP